MTTKQPRNKWRNSGRKISKELRDIIHGYLMSDGYITPSCSLQVEQGEKQKSFVQWLYKELEPIRNPTPIQTVRRMDKRTQKETRSCRFYTKAVLDGFRHIWYQPVMDSAGVTKYRKRLPKNIDCFFNETFISLWFAGDGTKIKDSVGAKFEVTCFTHDERHKLQSLFEKKFGIETKIHQAGTSKAGTPQWALVISAKEYPKFRHLITKIDLIPTVFPHKLHKKKSLTP